jgi:predicted RNase H-like HicB family nuclease
MKKIHVKVVVWREGKHHVAQCLNVDVSSFGKTKNEALKNIEEALELYFEDNAAGYHEVSDPSVETRQLQYA